MTPSSRTQTQPLKLERTFACSPEELWAAWEDPKLYAQWMNPAGIVLVIHEYDFREGGKVRFDMPQPDGNPNPQEGVFHEIKRHKRIASGAPDKSFLIEADFIPVKNGTRLVVTATGIPPEFHEGATAGWNQCFDLLSERVLGRRTEVTDREIILTRILDAPRELVWEAFVDPEQLATWWGPEGFKRNTIHAIDVRPGGAWRYTMHGPDGADYENLITYEKVEKPALISYKHGTPDEPEMFRGASTFEDVGDGRTKVTLKMTFPTHEALEAVIRDVGAVEGGNQTLDKLERHIQQMRRQ